MKDNVNYYELLGISKNASDDEIKKAYRVQAKKWHPDINKDNGSQDIFKELVNAKDTLLNFEKRKEYDNFLVRKKTPLYKNNDDENEENKFYTKWEYFKLYLKYYQNSKFRKFFSIILVGIETLICNLLWLINYLLVIILAYSKEFISYISSICIVLYVPLIIIKHSSIDISIISNSILYNLLVVFLLVLLIFLPDLIFNICITKVPLYLNNLNIFLFKKAIGYDK